MYPDPKPNPNPPEPMVISWVLFGTGTVRVGSELTLKLMDVGRVRIKR